MNSSTFSRGTFLLSQIPCGLAVVLCALVLDNILRQFGVDIHPWKEALFSAAAGMFFSSLFMPVVWRLGLTTLPQYMLGGLGVFIPATLLSVFAIYQFQPVIIDIIGFDFNSQSESKAWAMTISIRILRSVVLFPPYILMFWLVYHKHLGKKHL